MGRPRNFVHLDLVAVGPESDFSNLLGPFKAFTMFIYIDWQLMASSRTRATTNGKGFKPAYLQTIG
jgi:hypothetical protein